jgi:hypothetical protein
MAADAYESEVRLVEATDECHVAEHVGVPGVIHLEAVLELDDVTDRCAAFEEPWARPVRLQLRHVHHRRVLRRDHVDLDAGPQRRDRTAHVHPTGVFAESSTPAEIRLLASS